MNELVQVSAPAEGVAVVTLRRPEKHNALTAALLAGLEAAFRDLAGDPDLRAVVLTGVDPAFCAGLDLQELESRPAAFGPTALQAVRELQVPLIAAVNGAAVTGGLELALACDWRLASERARFADTHARVGVVPGWGLTAALSEAVGQSWARQMSFTGNFVGAELALRLGLVNEVVPHERLLDRAVALAVDISSTEATTLRRIRAVYDVAAIGTGAEALQAERDASRNGLLMADPAAFAARRASLLSRSRAQV